MVVRTYVGLLARQLREGCTSTEPALWKLQLIALPLAERPEAFTAGRFLARRPCGGAGH